VNKSEPPWNQQTFPLLPQPATSSASPRINPSFSANDIPSLTKAATATAAGSPKALPQRSSSMIFTPGSGPASQPPPQPVPVPLRMMDGGIAQATLDGFEPRMFPGILNRRRAMSVAQGLGEGEGQAAGRPNHASGELDNVTFDAVEEEEDEGDSDEA
jgi:hypothetical protein